MKGDGMVKRSSFGNLSRKKLSDVTNTILPPSQSKSPIDLEKLSPDESSRDYIDQLVKENMALVKLIQDQKKIIELSGAELQKLRISLQKLQQQNWSLAQSNSHMLAELNLGKEKLKTLRHELMCKETLHKSKCNEAKEGGDTKEPGANNNNKVKGNKQQRLMRSRSMGPSSKSQQVPEKGPAENKRRCVRRKSTTGFNLQKQQQKKEEEEGAEQPLPPPPPPRRPSEEDLFEIEDTNTTMKLPDATESDIPTPLESFQEKVDEKQHHQHHPGGRSSLPRSSLCRPARKAAERVQSYKEIPLNVKMRRTE